MDSEYKKARDDYRYWTCYANEDRKVRTVNAAIAADRCLATCPEYMRELWQRRVNEIDAEFYNVNPTR